MSLAGRASLFKSALQAGLGRLAFYFEEICLSSRDFSFAYGIK